MGILGRRPLATPAILVIQAIQGIREPLPPVLRASPVRRRATQEALRQREPRLVRPLMVRLKYMFEFKPKFNVRKWKIAEAPFVSRLVPSVAVFLL